ncbi:MAG: hypothetical protein ACYC4H_08850, partial [Desulfocucumaceae bacterium]
MDVSIQQSAISFFKFLITAMRKLSSVFSVLSVVKCFSLFTPNSQFLIPNSGTYQSFIDNTAMK